MEVATIGRHFEREPIQGFVPTKHYVVWWCQINIVLALIRQ